MHCVAGSSDPILQEPTAIATAEAAAAYATVEDPTCEVTIAANKYQQYRKQQQQ
jgi:hypothetical protein